MDEKELNKRSGRFQLRCTGFTTHLVHVGCVQSKRLTHLHKLHDKMSLARRNHKLRQQ